MDAERIACALEDIVKSLRTRGDAPLVVSTIFTVGDLVRCLGKPDPSYPYPYDGPLLGHVGVVREVRLSSQEPILVEWESPWKGHDGLGGSGGLIRRSRTGWWMKPSNLELA